MSALQWSQQHEQDALHEYCQLLSGGLTLIKAGLFVDKCGYLGASPDGIVLDSSGLPVKVVEVKCPFSAKDKTVEQACNGKSFCCSILDGKPRLKFITKCKVRWPLLDYMYVISLYGLRSLYTFKQFTLTASFGLIHV